MAISPELQKLLDTASATMPTPVPYAQQPIQFLQPQAQQSPVFQPIQIDTTLPTPYISNVPTFQPIDLPIYWQWTSNPINNTIPSIPIPTTLQWTGIDNKIQDNLNTLWYWNVFEAKQNIQNEYNAAEWNWFFNQLNQITNIPIQAVQSLWEYVLWWTQLWEWIKTSVENTRKLFWTEDIANQKLDWSFWFFSPLSAISTDISKNRITKIENTIGQWYQQDQENKRIQNSDYIESIIKNNIPRSSLFTQQQETNYNKTYDKIVWETNNDLLPYIEQFDRRIFEERQNWNEDRALQLEEVKKWNVNQYIKNTTEYIKRKTQLQLDDPSLNDREAWQMLNTQIASEYWNVNWFLKNWFKKLDWEVLKTSNSDLLQYAKENPWIPQSRDERRTPIDFLQNQGNELDRESINETPITSNPFAKIMANANRLISPVSWAANRVVWRIMENSLNAQTAAADINYLPTVWYSNRKESVWDTSLKVWQQVFDVIPELATNIWVMILTAPLSTAEAINTLSVWTEVWGMLNLNKVAWVVNTLKQLWKIGLAETLQNWFVDVNTQNYNNPANLTANIAWWILWNSIDFLKIWKDWRKIYTVDEATWLLRESARSQKKLDLIAQWKSIQEAQNIVNSLPDTELVWTNINVDYVDSVIKKQEAIKEWLSKDIKIYQNKVAQLEKESMGLEWEALITKQWEIIDAKNTLDRFKITTAKKAWEVAIINKFMQNPTEEWVTEFSRALKTFKPWELPIWIEDVYRIYNSSPLGIQEQAAWTLYNSILKSTDWYKKSQEITKITWLSPVKSYSISELDEVMKSANKSNAPELSRINEKQWDQFKYFDNQNWEYVLNSEWLKQMNLTESAPFRNIQRTMRSTEEWTESAKYFEIIDSNKVELWISDSDLNRLKTNDTYNELLETVNDFIPCII